MWSCFYKCPCCVRFRGESQTPLENFYEDDDNLEFERLLPYQDSTSLSALLSRNPFPRATNSPNYFGQHMTLPNEEATAANRLLLEDDENLQDAQLLPDGQISKFTELISEQVRNPEIHPILVEGMLECDGPDRCSLPPSTRGRFNEVTDAQLIEEEEDARRQEEEEIERKRQAATQSALAKGLISPEQLATNNKNVFFTIEGDDEADSSSNTAYSMNVDEDFSTTASNKTTPEHDSEPPISSLNKPRNPHERFLSKDVNLEDYDDVNDFEDISNYDQRSPNILLDRYHSRRSIIRDNQRKIEEDYSPFSVSILRSDDYEEYYSPTVGDVGDEEINPFANVLPDFSERVSRFFDRLANSMNVHNKSKEVDDENINLNDDLGVSKDNNNRSKKLLTFVTEPEDYRVGSSSSNENRNINGTGVRKGSLKLINRLTGLPIERPPTNESNS
ncbi:7096_t:CDS:2 [Acaulospora morrowiae]|uniref:7096_t:CDS:1 n=1 Tax=Acaulospora morrowiae TaxID=94023 RepID=A0A9N8ZEE8_9GLOM|nr:7096_t:CDS:2 [Acaulospora morrowiae]